VHRAVSGSPVAHSHRRWHCSPYNDVPGPRRDRDLWTPHRLDVGQRVQPCCPSILTQAKMRLSLFACPHLQRTLFFSVHVLLRPVQMHQDFNKKPVSPILSSHPDSPMDKLLQSAAENWALQGELARDRPRRLGPYRGEGTPRQHSPEPTSRKILTAKNNSCFPFWLKVPTKSSTP
jgi:hypothetical protein